MLQGTQAERRPKLYVDGGDIKVNKIWKSAEREVRRGFLAKAREGRRGVAHCERKRSGLASAGPAYLGAPCLTGGGGQGRVGPLCFYGQTSP